MSYVGNVGWQDLLLLEENILIKVLVKVLSNPNMHGKCTCGKQNYTFIVSLSCFASKIKYFQNILLKMKNKCCGRESEMKLHFQPSYYSSSTFLYFGSNG